jgi:hypothetical protein
MRGALACPWHASTTQLAAKLGKGLDFGWLQAEAIAITSGGEIQVHCLWQLGPEYTAYIRLLGGGGVARISSQPTGLHHAKMKSEKILENSVLRKFINPNSFDEIES